MGVNQSQQVACLMYYTYWRNITETVYVSCLYKSARPVPAAARSKAQVCGRSPAEIVGLNPTGDMDVCLL